MEKCYELWHLKSRNVVGDLDTLDEVLDILSDAARDHGIEEVKDYAILVYLGEESSLYAQAEELASIVERHMHALSN
jgi:hypothetical protein